MINWKFRRISRKGIERIRRGLLRSWLPGGTHRERCQNGEIDADTVRARALYDRNGTLLIANVSFYYSTSRTSQLDVFVNGKKEFMGGHRAIGDWLKNPACNIARNTPTSPHDQETPLEAT